VTTKSSATDMVTEVDEAVEALIVDRLAAARPDDGVNGEEGASREGTTGVVWQVDPIDGTTNFVYGYPGFAVSLAAELHGAAIAAAVYDVMRDELFTATKDGGAWRDGAAIRCTDAHSIAAALVATGFSYEPERRARQAHVLTAVLPAVRDIRRGGAASTDLCAVACGRVDAYYERGLQPWDHAAGALIAAEAGAIVGDLDGGQPSWEFTLAAAPALFDALRTILCDAGARDA
ncbi:MAG: inositol monophosphatase family protein, partial [Acidimicrobiales bacterium]